MQSVTRYFVALAAVCVPALGSAQTYPTKSVLMIMKAILSSSDHRLLTCDFTDFGGKSAAGLCVDDTKRVYDVIFTGPRLLIPA